MKYITFIILSLFFVQTSFSQAKKKADKDTQAWRYEIEATGVGLQGTNVVKVWSYSKKKDIAMEQCKKNAVHAIIFRGFASNKTVRVSQKPLATNPNIEMEQAEFFKNFFADGGKYMKFVQISADGLREVIQVGKEYKVGVVLVVNFAELRKDLEAAGIIKSMTEGF